MEAEVQNLLPVIFPEDITNLIGNNLLKSPGGADTSITPGVFLGLVGYSWGAFADSLSGHWVCNLHSWFSISLVISISFPSSATKLTILPPVEVLQEEDCSNS